MAILAIDIRTGGIILPVALGSTSIGCCSRKAVVATCPSQYHKDRLNVQANLIASLG